MEYYQGQSDTDQIQGGGSYVQEEGMGHEVCNYMQHNGAVFGYVQPPKASGPGEGNIRIERIGADSKDHVDGVLVVWTATRPEGRTAVIGWYKNATVYRTHQYFHSVPKLHKENGLKGYWIKAASEDTTLLSVDERILEIPRRVKGGMGQANIWYADSPDSVEILNKVMLFINGKRTKQRTKRSRTTDPEHNAKVEAAAIHKVSSYFEDIGYRVKSVEKDNVGWDLEATSDMTSLKIEVKGLSGNAAVGELSPNEFKAFSSESSDYRLAIVINSLIDPILLLCRYSREKHKWIVEGNMNYELQIEPKTSATVKVCI